MKPKIEDRKKAIELRKRGFSYNEIRQRIRVSKSSLSLWLRSVGLSKQQKQRLTEKKQLSTRNGWEKWRAQRIAKTQSIKAGARQEIPKITREHLFLMGSMLYWAEGAKEKPWRSAQVKLNNTDPRMLTLFLLWLTEICKVPMKDIRFEIYLHENSVNNVAKVQQYWSRSLNIPKRALSKVYFKNNEIKTHRHNTGMDYYGGVTVRVGKSTDFNRKIAGWIEGVDQQLQNFKI
ncbi:MAG: hypothetical protein Q8P39_01550 [Candidatus Yanofskybacteria bacterium]|nr:hypothetical protein [Candidatus Yanofskybacteria bacterium]